MGVKANIQKKFSNDAVLGKERLLASKFSFIIFSFLFFLNYFFVSAGIGGRGYLLFSYVIFVISFIFFTFFIIKQKLAKKVPGFVFHILLFLLFIIGALFIAAFVLSEGMFPHIS